MTDVSLTQLLRKPSQPDDRAYKLPRAQTLPQWLGSRRSKLAIALIAADAVSLLLATLGALALTAVVSLQPANAPAAFDLPLLIAAGLFVRLYGSCGLRDFERFELRLQATALYVGLSLFFWALFESIAGLLPYLLVQGGLLLVFGFYADLAIRKRLLLPQLGALPALVVGEDERAEALKRHLAATVLEYGLSPIGIVRPGRLGQEDADRLLDEAEVIVLAGQPAQPIDRLERSHTILLADDASHPGGGSGPLIGQAHVRFRPVQLRTEAGYLRLKRALDIALTLPAAIFAFPVIGLLALAVKWFDPGPAFFVQPRVCRGGKLKPIYKIRSMYLDAEERLERHLAENPAAREEWERHCKLREDPRILPVIGRLIRTTSLDELPQLWNILRGDISLVGPRPFPVYHHEKFDPEFQKVRASVPPGLTGFWQITSRSSGDLDVQKSQDTFYIENRSILFDIYIILKTVPAVLSGRGAH